MRGKRFPGVCARPGPSWKEISIFTNTEDMPLREVLQKMAEKHEQGPAINPKRNSLQKNREK
ncbi:MAG: hypothetical protein U5L09_21045 [Bacteroidales bacterium]|nr:hypothetical protein [Bacteroidales bacterium]